MTEEQRDKVLLDIQKKIGSMDSRMGKMDSRFDKMDERIDKMDSRFDKMDERMDKMDSRFDKMDERMNQMDTRFDKMDSRMDKIDTRLDKMDSKMDTNINTKLNEIDKKVSEMHFKLIEWEPILDYAQKYTSTHNEKIASLRKKVESNKKGLANHEKRISLLESKKVLNQ